jgi:hypothetical protein
MNIKKIIQEEVNGNEDIILTILGNQYVVVRDNELKPYSYFDDNGQMAGKYYITGDEYEELKSFMDGIGITLRKFNYNSNDYTAVYSMRFKMRDEVLKNYIDIMSGDTNFPN